MRPIGWLLFFLKTVFAGQPCQDGGLEFFESFNTSSCIYFEYEALNYNDAKNSCLSRGLDLIQFRDVSTSMFVNSFIPDNNQDEPWYIGVERNRDGVWVYADNTTLQYTNWAADATDEVIRYECVTMKLGDGFWRPSDCETPRRHICQGGKDSCPPEWHYFQETQTCLYFSNFTLRPDGDIKLFMPEQAAEACAEKDGQLANIFEGFAEVLWKVKFQAEIKADEKFVSEHGAAYNFTCELYASMWLRFYEGGEVPSPAKHSRPHYARINQDSDCEKYSHFVDQNITVTFPRYICERAMRFSEPLY
ncbi:unnamed protein product, partial [Mesorhabditis spiculigera]